MTETITLYGSADCDDTERTRAWLAQRRIPYREVDIDHDPGAEQFVRFINKGFRSTPTVVIGEGRRKIVITEPTDSEAEAFVRQAGYALP